jgi:crotonobetainyl-CoA:carnitine CoA-transferase CaiB-like acyl-CoA transferase
MVSSDRPATGPLDDVRVLSFGAFVAGNTCPMALAELGADVVKIESRVAPEALRAYHHPAHPIIKEPSGVETTVLFAGLTRSMRSLCLEMKTEAGRDLFRRLVGHCDVVIENFGPGQMDKWGCSFADLLPRNPRLVMLSISGYGRTGPRSSHRAYASNINNILGLTAAWAPNGVHFDYVAGIQGASAVLAGLSRAQTTGHGVYIDLAQTDSGAAVMAPLYLEQLSNGNPWSAEPNEVPGALMSVVVNCQGSDAWVAIELEDAADWETICALLERPDLRLTTHLAKPHQRDALQAVIEQWASRLTPYQAAQRLQTAGIAAGPVQSSEDLWRDPQLRTRGAVVEIDHPDMGVVEFPNSPDHMSRTPGRVKYRGPRLGEHSHQVTAEWLRLTRTQIRELAAQGAIWSPDPGEPADNDTIRKRPPAPRPGGLD